MMDELVSAVSSRTGLSQEQAQAAVSEVISLLKNRLPAPLGGALDSLLGVQASAAAATGDNSGSTGGGEGLAQEAEELLGDLFKK